MRCARPAAVLRKPAGWERIVADYAPAHDDRREAAWIAELDGRRVGCVFCVAEDAATASST